MKTDNMNRQVCYNVQNAVDTKHHLIVSHDITMSTDMGQLSSVAAQVQEALVPQTNTSGSKKKGIFIKSLFKYDKNKDIYTCPAGETPPHRRNVV
jgi:hypothetical protein